MPYVNVKVLGYQKKSAFNEIINGKRICLPERIIFHVERNDNPLVHGVSVSTITFSLDHAIRMNGGSDYFERYLCADVRLFYLDYHGEEVPFFFESPSESTSS